MSFSIFASGVAKNKSHFNYSRDNCADNDVFDAAAVASALMAARPSGADKMSGLTSGVAGATDYALPNHSSGVFSALGVMASLIFQDTLKTVVTSLAMKAKSSMNPYIFLSCRESNLLMPDGHEIARYNFLGSNPGLDFFKTILPALKATDMNNYGVLRQLTICLSEYNTKLGSGTPMIMIELSK